MNTERNYTVIESVSNQVIIKAKELIVDDIIVGTLKRITEFTFNAGTPEEKTEPVFHFQLLEPFKYQGNILPEGTFVSICNGAFKRTRDRLQEGADYAIHWRGEKPNKGKPGSYHDWGINHIAYSEKNPVTQAPSEEEDFGEFGE
jgi:hypothetical protein